MAETTRMPNQLESVWDKLFRMKDDISHPVHHTGVTLEEVLFPFRGLKA